MIRPALLLLAGTAAIPASAQDAALPPEENAAPVATADEAAPAEADEFADEEEIVVVGARPRGSVIGDIPPENTLDSRDIRATGAASIDELLEALEPQIGSARGRASGGRPILLLNGQRISGFRELRDLPPEAIQRMEILPEEVALKYGYRADQRVVNIVLRQRFRSTTARADGILATEGGYAGGLADVSRLMINRGGRTTINLHAETNSALDEDERDVDLAELEPGATDPRPFRSLIGERRLVRGSGTVNRTVLGDVSATLNGEVEHSDGLAGIGIDGSDPLRRDTNGDAARLGLALNGDKGGWRWSVTGNGEIQNNITLTDRADDVRDRSESTSTSASLDGTLNGPLFKLPAGDVTTTVRVGANALGLDSERRRLGVVSATDLSRGRGTGAINIDVPIARRGRALEAIGNLTLNGNAEVERLSDFGTLSTVGAGLNWSPVERLNLIASWTREEGAPSIQQLGDPVLDTPGSRIFDFTRGETVLATVISGGNPELGADRRNVLKIGGNWKPFEETDLRLRADYVRSRLDNPISSFPGASAALEAAFPERFVRDGDGNLLSVDLRPVNFDQARRDTFRWGIDFSKPLKSARPSQAQMEQMRARFAPPGRAGGRGDDPAPADGQPPAGAGGRQVQAERGGRGFGRGGFGGRGGGERGRLTLSFTHSVNLVDEVTIRPGLPELDYLDGDALGSSGGRPRHEVQVRTGWSNNGLGARLSGNWRSGTRVEGGPNGDLDFAPYGTIDLRLFANLGERFDLVSKYPWLIGSSVRLEVDNLFDSKPKVRDGLGEVPFSYQGDLLEPLGRTVTVSLRKLFLPARARRGGGGRATR